MWKSSDDLVLAVSTGIDSMVLLHQLIHDYAHTYRKLACVHVNHGLRSASDEEAIFIQQYCHKHDIPIYIHQLDLSDVVNTGKSIQNDARERRYQWFDSVMQQLNADYLVTAHHQDDQLETIFYRIFTGRTSRSSIGMHMFEPRADYHIVRPFIHTTKQSIQKYQHEHQVPYYEDESNAHNDYVRNDIRNRILPTIEKNTHLQPQQLLKLFDIQETAQMLIQQQADHFIHHHVQVTERQIIISRNDFNKELPHVKMNILDHCFAQFSERVQISERAYQDWFEKIESSVAQTPLMHTNEWRADVVYDKLIIIAQPSHETVEKLHITHPGWYAFEDYRIYITQQLLEMGGAISIRTRYNGDRVALRSGHHKKVSRLMIDAKVPALLRQRMPIIETSNGHILAVGLLYVQEAYRDMIHIQYLGDDINGK